MEGLADAAFAKHPRRRASRNRLSRRHEAPGEVTRRVGCAHCDLKSQCAMSTT